MCSMPDTTAGFYWGCSRFPIWHTFYPQSSWQIWSCFGAEMSLTCLCSAFPFSSPDMKLWSLHQPSLATCHFSVLIHMAVATTGCCVCTQVSSTISTIFTAPLAAYWENKLVLEATFITNRLKSLQLLWKKIITFSFKTTSWQHPFLFTYPQCHSHWKDPSCSEQKRRKTKRINKKRRFETLRMKDRNRSRSSQVAQLVREHEQAGLLPERSDRWGKRQQCWEEPLPSEILVGTPATSHPASGAQGQLHGLGLWLSHTHSC